MYGTGFAKGMWVTLRHFIATYADDVRYGWRKYSHSVDNFEARQGARGKGAFTVQYPDEKLAMPERFRFVPFLVVEDYDHPERPGWNWCTACGICAKVCPPQCIWIVRDSDPETGRPVTNPQAFFIDIDLCMNCGFCAEFCPFDAIKMDHDYELASYDRTSDHIFDIDKLSKEFRYWKTIAPTRVIEEAEARGGWEHKDIQKEARTGKKSTTTTAREPKAEAAPETTAVAEAAPKAAAATKAATKSGPNLGDEEARKARREAALKRKAQRGAKGSE